MGHNVQRGAADAAGCIKGLCSLRSRGQMKCSAAQGNTDSFAESNFLCIFSNAASSVSLYSQTSLMDTGKSYFIVYMAHCLTNPQPAAAAAITLGTEEQKPRWMPYAPLRRRRRPLREYSRQRNDFIDLLHLLNPDFIRKLIFPYEIKGPFTPFYAII